MDPLTGQSALTGLPATHPARPTPVSAEADRAPAAPTTAPTTAPAPTTERPTADQYVASPAGQAVAEAADSTANAQPADAAGSERSTAPAGNNVVALRALAAYRDAEATASPVANPAVGAPTHNTIA